MNRIHVILSTLLLGGFLACAQTVKRGSEELCRALTKGAEARVTFRVVDADGNVVTGATVGVSLDVMKSEYPFVKGLSDTNGLFSVEGRSKGEVDYAIEMAGYYPSTRGNFVFHGTNDRFLLDGKWLPWDPTNTVIIKQMKNPVAMCVRYQELHIPEVGKPLAFDFEKGEWVRPYGNGEASDIIVLYEYTEVDSLTFSRKLTLTFGTNVLDGVRREKQDTFSKFQSLYEAPEKGYERCLSWVFERTKDKVIKDTGDSKDECLVFRVRTQVDDKGNIVKANYGKIYGPIDCWCGRNTIKFPYYFNPEVNSRNLEFDPAKNLSGQKVPMP